VPTAGHGHDPEQGTTSVTLAIPAMDCPSCASTVERALRGVPGVRDGTPDATTGTVRLDLDAEADVEDAVDAVEDAGYEVVDVQHGDRAPGAGVADRSTVWTSPRAVRATVGGLLVALGGLAVLVEPAGRVPLPVSNLAWAELAFLAAVAAAGWDLVPEGARSLWQRRLDMDLLMSAAILGAIASSVGFGEDVYFEAAMLAVLFSLAELLERYAIEQARGSLRELVELTPDEARVRRDGEEVPVSVDEIRVGETVIVRPGERIPVDGRVVDGDSAVDQAPITGESIPVDKIPGDEVYAGTINREGYLEVEATSAAADNTLARIVRLVEEAQADRTEREQFVDRFAGIYTPVVVGLAVLLAVVPPLVVGAAWPTYILYGLTLLVLACPCAFVISTPVSVVSGITSAARNGVLVKGGRHLEAMGEVEAVALDKTGTLTEGTVAVTDVVPLNGNTEADVLRCAAGVEARSEHPIARAIVDRVDEERPPETDVEAFESLTGKGVKATLAGTPHYAGKPGLFDELGFDLDHVHATTDHDAVPAKTQDVCDRSGCLDLLDGLIPELQAQGKTVVLVGTEDEVEGVIALADGIRTEAEAAVARLHDLGVETVIVLTGDNRRTARAVADRLGIDEVHAELLPEEKVDVVEDLAERHDGVAMVGDGINDAPALATATVGVAMGAAGTDTAMETADIALLGDDLAKLPYLYELAGDANAVIRQNIGASLGVKALLAVGVPFGLVPIWLAVLAGDAGMTLGVTGNATRLSRLAPEPQAAEAG